MNDTSNIVSFEKFIYKGSTMNRVLCIYQQEFSNLINMISFQDHWKNSIDFIKIRKYGTK